MNDILGKQWLASQDPDIKSGVATYKTDKKTITLKLESFSDFLAINEMLKASFNTGKQNMKDTIRNLTIN